MLRLFVTASFLLFLILLTRCSSSAQEGAFIDIQPGELEELLEQEEVTIIDVRTSREWQGGIVEGALTINLNDPGFVERIGQLDADGHYLIYCNSGNRSRVASRLMLENGLENIYNYNGMHTQIRREHREISSE